MYGLSQSPIDAEPLELLFLHLDPMGGEVAAFAGGTASIGTLSFDWLLGAVLLLDDPLDRQAVAVPARHIGRVLAEHLLRAVDDVLQDLVQRVAEMEVAIGVRRPVMQDEFFAALRASRSLS